MGAKLISFSLWGSKRTNLEYAVLNADIAKLYYPGWKCRFYIGEGVPDSTKKVLEYLKAEIIEYIPMHGAWEGLFKRFYPIMDEENDYVIIRDVDSLLSYRGKAAVDEWILSDKPFHIMRDHPAHSVEMLGGMWGSVGGTFPNLATDIENWLELNKKVIVEKGDDQIFLTDKVWPYAKLLHIAHDSAYLEKYNECDSRPFPPHREDHPWVPFVGAIIDEAIAGVYNK